MAKSKSTAISKSETVSVSVGLMKDRVIKILLDSSKMLQQATNFHQVKLIADVAAAQEVYAKRQQLGQEVEDYAHRLKIEALSRLGELLDALPKNRGGGEPGVGRKGKNAITDLNRIPAATLAELGIDPRTSMIAQQLAALPHSTREAIAMREQSLSSARREAKRVEVKSRLDDVVTRDAKEAEGVFDVIVIDPPWPMEKIERDVRPNQVEFEYPTMGEDELETLRIPYADDCHVWMWTTQKFLPMAFRLLDKWALKYVCTFVWHKPGGFQPIGLPQYNCEFALYARKGSPIFLDTKDFPTCFNAMRGAHSEKPEPFYDVLRRVTAGRRLDMFNRRKIEGFDGWGLEVA